MIAKPSYEELERRIQELEIIESEYKHLMEGSKENESLFKRLYEKAPLGYQSLDENGHFLVVNPTWLDTLGYTKEEVIGKSFADFLHPDYRDHFKENFPRFKSIGEVLGVEFEMVKKNGDLILVSFTGKISRDKHGAFQQTHCIFHDITERKQTEEALRESEERYREIVNLAVDGILQGSADGKIIGANSQMQKWLGRPLEQILGLHVSELFDPEELKAKPLRFDLLNLKQPLVNERNLRRSDGTSLPVEMHSKRMPDGTYQSIYRDITERKRVEAELKDANAVLAQKDALLRSMLHNLPFDFWARDLHQNMLIQSKESVRVWGDLTGIAFHEANVAPEYLAVWKATNARVLTGEVVSGEQVYAVCGEPRQFHAIVAPILLDEEVQGILGINIDITDHKQAEEALLTERQYLIDIIDSLPDATLIIDTSNRLVVWNRAAEAMTNVNRSELLGKGGYAYAVPFYGEPRPILIDLLDISEKEMESSYTHVKRIGEKIYAETFIQALNNGEGAHLWGVAAQLYSQSGLRIGAIEVIKDVTGLKLSEKNNILLQTQLQQAQKMEAVGQLAGGVAHDFNNMLGVIIGYSELILEQVDPSQQFHAELGEIQKAARRSANLTRQLLTFARKQTVEPRILDLNQTIEGMFNMLTRLIGENIDLIWMPGSCLWKINMDPSQIDQILANLCVNARDAINGVGTLTVETKNVTFDKEYCATHAGSLPGEFVRIAVSDTGSGMDKETLAHIFEPFFTTKGVGEGTGLGLATVYGAVKQNSGFINAYSEPGQGTTFTIYLPRYIEKTTQAQITESVKPVLHGDEIIMLVEDEPTLLEMSKTMLERLGYTVLVAGTPSEAIRLASEYSGQIHLLATDVIMPEMNGRQLSARLLESRPEMKCLFMSGYTANIIANQGLLKEGVAFIQKPFSKSELTAKVREALQS